MSGAEKHIYCLAVELQHRGIEVEVVVPVEGWLPDLLRSANIPTHVRGMRGKKWFSTAAFLAQRARKPNSVIHTHLTRASYLGFAVSSLTRTPIIATVHVATDDVIYRKIATSQRGTLVAVSNFIKSFVAKAGLDERLITVVHNGTSMFEVPKTPKESVLEEFKIAPGTPLIGLVGRVSVEKGHLEMLAAMPEILNACPKTKLLLIGRIQPGFEDSLQVAIKQHALEESVIITGPRDDVPHLLDAIDISVMPSHIEAMPLVAIESMSRAKPVVANNVGGLPEAVIDGDTGILTTLEPSSIAAAIIKLRKNPELATKMGERGREVAMECFSLTKMVDSLVAVYQSALQRRRK
ncbi:MAG: glycosyltransferase family 4 protein [Armatimonadetes bacterium]|nr:glycosyltransferase family 4 protein [Armatimonadota bacterium]